jgi:hypothetical protein
VIQGRERRRKQLLDDLKQTGRDWKLKEATQLCTLWRSSFCRGCEPVSLSMMMMMMMMMISGGGGCDDDNALG